MSIHLIDDTGYLQPEKKITEFLSSLAPPTEAAEELDILRAVGVNYHVVGVFGGQSSGKSTLLNHLFGTTFQTLDESVRRGQTTKGAFVGSANSTLEGFSRSATESPLLVVDFEGTDGLERGEDQSFERQLSLFGLSIADTLIINMWAVDVGRFNAANLSLLRTIFEVNLQLFSHDSYVKEEKPTLLVVLRDFTDADATPSMTTVRKSFDTIWESIAKPAAFSDSPIDALFDLKYYVMQHYKLQRPEFDRSVTELRRWFGDTTYSNYLFHQKEMFRRVPMDALPSYLTNCWEAIRTSKDLDIPTQREMLAQHRCKEVRDAQLMIFFSFCRDYEKRIGDGEMLLRLSEVLDTEIEARITDYGSETRLYRSEVVADHAAELEQDLVKAAMHTLDRMSAVVAAEVLSSTEARAQRVVDDCMYRLLKSAQSLPFVATSTESKGLDSAEDGSAQSTTHTTYQLDNTECQRLGTNFWRSTRAELNEILAEMSAVPPPVYLFGRYTSLVAQDATIRAAVVNRVIDTVFKKVQVRLVAMAENAPETMHSGFEKCLSHNPDGTVKFFATTKGLQQVVPAAQQAGLVLLGCLFYFRLDLRQRTDEEELHPGDSRLARHVRQVAKLIVVRQSTHEKDFYLTYTTLDAVPKYPVQVPIVLEAEADDGVSAACILLNHQSVERACEVFHQKCDFTVQLQLRSIEAGKQRLPAWVIPALFILGFNELCYVLSSPILLLCIIAICAIFFQSFITVQWQTFVETGPSAVVLPLQAAVQYVAPLLKGVVPATCGDADSAARKGDSSVHSDPTAGVPTTVPSKATMRRRNPERDD